MRSILLATEALRYTAEVRRLGQPADTFSVSILSIWPGAKDPTAERTLIQLTLDAAGLVALRELVDAALTEVVPS